MASRRVCLGGSVRLASDSQSGFLLDISGSKYYKLNASALYICNAMRETVDVNSLVEAYQRATGTHCPSAGADLLSFLYRMEELGLCRISEID